MTQAMKRGLGRGLESLLPPPITSEAEEGSGYRAVPIDSIIPNRQQPRTVFDEEKLRELSASIREQGLIQPLAVSRLSDGRYELIAGERRLRASRMAGLEEVPVVIREVDSEGMLALSIIENIQREDLNPIEEANAYQELMGQFNHTQDDVAKKVGKSRVAVANCVRLLRLPRVVQDDVASGRYSAGHARAILAVEGLHEQLKVRERIIREMPTVRDVEKMVQALSGNGKKTARKGTALTPQMNELCERMKQSLGTKVALAPGGNGGRITIEYYSPQDLDRIFSRIIGS
ncbi:MAG: ParB/RepB/Spo0J family partition protein [bacterium]